MNWIFYSIQRKAVRGVCYTAAEQVVKNVDKNSYIALSNLVSLIVFLFMSKNHLAHDVVEIQKSPNLTWFLVAVSAAVVGQYMSILAIQTSNASLAASLEITYPFCCLLLAWFLFGTAMSWVAMFGVVVIFLGVLIVIYGQ